MLRRADLITPVWPAPRNVRALVTTRSGGDSVAPYTGFNLALHTGDEVDVVLAHRAQLLGLAGLTSAGWLDQVHGVEIIDLAGTALNPPPADGSICRQPGVACTIMMADCLPVLVCDDTGSVVGAAHCGWRGLAGGVLEALITRLAVPGHRLLAWLGPAISSAHYEVGSDVHGEVARRFSPAVVAATMRNAAIAGKWRLDLCDLARAELQRLGVTRIHGGGYCTYADARFYSYRRDGVTGRMAAMIWLSGGE